MNGETSRREFLAGAAAGLGLGAIVTVGPAHATPAEMQDAVRKLVGSAPVTKGRVKLELPPLSENGNTVPLTVSVESAMTPADAIRQHAGESSGVVEQYRRLTDQQRRALLAFLDSL